MVLDPNAPYPARAGLGSSIVDTNHPAEWLGDSGGSIDRWPGLEALDFGVGGSEERPAWSAEGLSGTVDSSLE